MLGDNIITKEFLLEKILQEISDMEKVVSELEEKREKIKQLRKKLRAENKADNDAYRELKKLIVYYGGSITHHRNKVIKLQNQYKQYQDMDI